MRFILLTAIALIGLLPDDSDAAVFVGVGRGFAFRGRQNIQVNNFNGGVHGVGHNAGFRFRQVQVNNFNGGVHHDFNGAFRGNYGFNTFRFAAPVTFAVVEPPPVLIEQPPVIVQTGGVGYGVSGFQFNGGYGGGFNRGGFRFRGGFGY